MSLSGKRIVIDAGHGGKYPGAVYGTRKESYYALKYAEAVSTKLKALGAVPLMTRTADVDFGGTTASEDINNRVKFINSKYGTNYNALVSVHLNTAGSSIGPLCQTGNSAGAGLANLMNIACPNGIVRIGDYAILRDTNGPTIPKVIMEIATVSDSDLDFVDTHANVIVNGLKLKFGA